MLTSTSVVIKNILRERELRTHQIPEIRACPYIRQLQDVIEQEENEWWPPSEPKKMVLEWMDADLWQCRPHGKPANPKLPQIVAKSILEALAVFQRLHAVHTGNKLYHHFHRHSSDQSRRKPEQYICVEHRSNNTHCQAWRS